MTNEYSPEAGNTFYISTNGHEWHHALMLFNDGVTFLVLYDGVRMHFSWDNPDIQVEPIKEDTKSNSVFFKHDNGVYLKVLDNGHIVLADTCGDIIGGQTDVRVNNGTGYLTTATVTFEVSGWAKD